MYECMNVCMYECINECRHVFRCANGWGRPLSKGRVSKGDTRRRPSLRALPGSPAERQNIEDRVKPVNFGISTLKTKEIPSISRPEDRKWRLTLFRPVHRPAAAVRLQPRFRIEYHVSYIYIYIYVYICTYIYIYIYICVYRERDIERERWLSCNPLCIHLDRTGLGFGSSSWAEAPRARGAKLGTLAPRDRSHAALLRRAPKYTTVRMTTHLRAAGR